MRFFLVKKYKKNPLTCPSSAGKIVWKMFVMMSTTIRRWALLMAMLVGVSRGLIQPKMSNLFSSADSDDLASSWLTSDTAAIRYEIGGGVQQPEQRWIKPSPKGCRFIFAY